MTGSSFRLAFTLARRELRGSLGRFRVFLIALTLGVTAIGAVGSIADAMRAGISANSRALFGGDIEASSTQREVPPEMRAEMQAHGTVSSLIDMRAMLAAEKDGQPIRRLTGLKAVDDNWPLLGTPVLDPPIPLAEALARQDGRPGVVASAGVLRILGLKVGDIARLGMTDVRIGAVLISEPDQNLGFGAFAPRVIIHRDFLAETGLLAPGTLLTYRERLRLETPQDDMAVLDRLGDSAGNSLVRIRHHRQGSAGFESFLSRTETFLTLVSLTALLIGGLGVSTAVRAWLGSRMPVLATLKCLGAPAALIFRVYFLQVLALTALGIGIGLMLAILAPLATQILLADRIAVPIASGIYPVPLLAAAAYGLLTAVAFSLWPLGKARDVNPSQLFRTLIAAPAGRPKGVYLAGIALATLGLALLTGWITTSLKLAGAFILGVLVSLGLLALLGEAVIRLSGRLPVPSHTPLRLAIAALVRPGNATRSVIITFGLGLAVLVAVALSEHSMRSQISDRLERDAPAWFFIDIQPDQRQAFLDIATAHVPRDHVMMVPLVRGRITALAGVPAEKIDAPSSEAWILRGDRGLTWMGPPPEGARIVKGQWWPDDYTGPLQTSMDDEALEAFGLKIGDTVDINIAGRDMVATITSSRAIEWQNFGLNFVFILSPGMIEQAPHNWVATVRTDDRAIEAAIDRDVAALLPNVSSISVREAAATASRILGLVSTAIQITAGITLVAGFAVLAGTVAASEARRIQSSIILKVLGATRPVILFSYILEYALLGLVTALVAVGIGTAASWGMIRGFLDADFVFAPDLAAAVALGGVTATVLLGLVGASRTLGRKPGPVLREESV
ncbi:ABC transporter permease [Alphaproteobacteria bacterium LSUCC0684]